MTNALTYSSFAVAITLIVLIFVTAKTYSQLAFGAILYPALIFLGLMLFPRKSLKLPAFTLKASQNLKPQRAETSQHEKETTYIADIDKRAFIKLVGATGISFFLVSLLGRRFETLILGKSIQPGINPIGNGDQYGLAGTSPTDGYKISEVDEGPVTYYGFTNKDGAWLIMREGEDGSSFRYAKGSSDFPGNWEGRENLKYDYFYNLN